VFYEDSPAGAEGNHDETPFTILGFRAENQNETSYIWSRC